MVLLRRVVLVNQNNIGLGICVSRSRSKARPLRGLAEDFAGAVSAMPQVMEFYRMAGDVDSIMVPDMGDVFYKKLISAVPLKTPPGALRWRRSSR